jgi:hypothetical protein
MYMAGNPNAFDVMWRRNRANRLHFIRSTRVNWCREGESNPYSPFGPADFKSAASANFAIPAMLPDRCQYCIAAHPLPVDAADKGEHPPTKIAKGFECNVVAKKKAATGVTALSSAHGIRRPGTSPLKSFLLVRADAVIGHGSSCRLRPESPSP